MLPGNVQLPGFSAGLTEKKTENGAALRDPSSMTKVDPDGVRKIRVQKEGIHPRLILAQPSEIKPLELPTGSTLLRQSSAWSARAGKIVYR